MQSNVNIENALRNVEQIEVPSSTYDKVENVLKSLKQKDIETTHVRRIYKKPLLVAAIITMTVLALSTVALAYTGVLSGVFSTIIAERESVNQVDTLATDTRVAIVEHEHVVTAYESHIAIADDGSILELNAYFVDAREIWFDFTLSNADIPADWNVEEDHVIPGLFYLEMIYADGTMKKWETIVDDYSERTTFPGGYSFIDHINNTSDFVADENSHVHVPNNIISLNDDGSLNITIIVSFSYPHPPIGERINVHIGNLRFSGLTDSHLFVEGADNSALANITWLTGIWEFDIDVDSRFTDASQLVYSVVDIDEAAQYGITIHSIIVTPTATRVEATIDLSKNNLLNPDYIVFHEPINMDGETVVLENPTRQDILDMGLFLNINAILDSGQRVDTTGEARAGQNGDVIEGWWEFGSIFFEAPESLTLVFEPWVSGGEHIDGGIHVPILLVR